MAFVDRVSESLQHDSITEWLHLVTRLNNINKVHSIFHFMYTNIRRHIHTSTHADLASSHNISFNSVYFLFFIFARFFLFCISFGNNNNNNEKQHLQL